MPRRLRHHGGFSALLFSAIVLGLSIPGRTMAQPYQSLGSRDYPNGIVIPTLPTMYMNNKSFAKSAQALGREAVEAIKNCDRDRFNDAILNLKRNLAQLSEYANSLRVDDKANSSQPRDLTIGEIFHGAFSVFVFGEDPYLEVHHPQPDDPPNTRRAINDANTVASVILMLQQKSRAHCNPPAPPTTRGQTGMNFSTTPPSSFYAGGSLGGIGRTSTFDDGFRIASGTGYFDIYGGYRTPISAQSFIGAQVSFGMPFSGATKEFAQTRLQFAATGELQIGTTFPFTASLPVTLFAGAGGAIGSVRSGTTFPGFAYSDTQAMAGLTASLGASVPVIDNLSVVAQVRYLNLPYAAFHSPFGSYSFKQEAWIGTLGVRWMFAMN
jgi:opacity protein-like surface antigen